MSPSIQLYISVALFLTVITLIASISVSDCALLREINLLDDLKPYYGLKLINQLFGYQVDRRIENMIQFSGQSNLTSDQLMFANVLIDALKMVSDLVGKSINSTVPTIDEDLHRLLVNEYESIVNHFMDELTDTHGDGISVDRLTPKSLTQRLNLVSNLTNCELIKSQGLQLIDLYKQDITFVLKGDTLEVQQRQLVKFALDQLDSIKGAIERVEFTLEANIELPIYTLKLLLKRFDLIVQLIVGKPYKLNV